MIDFGDGLRIPDAELEFLYSRSGGSGGQNVNKVNSRAQLRFRISANSSLPEPVRQRFLRRFSTRLSADGELLLASDRHRDRLRNRNDCLERLGAMLREVLRAPKRRIATRPTRGSKLRGKAEKQRQARKKKERSGRWE